MIVFLSQPWPWYVAGPLIGLVMLSLHWFGATFGMSSNLTTLCSMSGAGKRFSLFDYDWREKQWNLVVLLGVVLGGSISAVFLNGSGLAPTAAATVSALADIGINPQTGFLPQELFGTEALSSPKGVILLLLGGFFVGFGSRYAGGCTSGHAITGLSSRQFPSLLAVIGFFAGGLLMTHLILPYLL